MSSRNINPQQFGPALEGPSKALIGDKPNFIGTVVHNGLGVGAHPSTLVRDTEGYNVELPGTQGHEVGMHVQVHNSRGSNAGESAFRGDTNAGMWDLGRLGSASVKEMFGGNNKPHGYDPQWLSKNLNRPASEF